MSRVTTRSIAMMSREACDTVVLSLTFGTHSGVRLPLARIIVPSVHVLTVGVDLPESSENEVHPSEDMSVATRVMGLLSERVQSLVSSDACHMSPASRQQS
jgi:voltage-gated potassium channel Kch